MALAQVVHEEQEPCALEFGDIESMRKFNQVLGTIHILRRQNMTNFYHFDHVCPISSIQAYIMLNVR